MNFLRPRAINAKAHLVRNVFAKVPRKLKKIVADDLRSIFYASSKKKAMKSFNVFKDK
ncbi:MAG: hypothetical protein DRP37_02475 [Thermodesulfobacteriota bacterium]|nr:MAG: hypothetical protein DRP37_02475 [Thermodesulfobacteriota bacterium]